MINFSKDTLKNKRLLAFGAILYGLDVSSASRITSDNYIDYAFDSNAEAYDPSERVSLSPLFLEFCPQCSLGVKVGYNKAEQTAGSGECIKNLWHADKEYGACLLNSF